MQTSKIIEVPDDVIEKLADHLNLIAVLLTPDMANVLSLSDTVPIDIGIIQSHLDAIHEILEPYNRENKP